ncbi:Cna B-type domain-containing protein, partial [Lactococcus piscium]
FVSLPKFVAGKAIVYTVSEVTVTGYDTTVNGYDLTNTHTPAKPNQPVTPTTPNKPKGSNLPKISEMINSLYNLIGFVMLALAGFGLVLAKKGKL